MKKATDEMILSAYRQAGSVWKAAAQLGMCGQSVHRRLQRMGRNTPMRLLTEPEKRLIRRLYRSSFARGDGRIRALVKEIGRTRHFIARFARSEGLTDYHRPICDSLGAQQGERVKKIWAERGHPRGMLGKHHSTKTRAALGPKLKAAYARMSAGKKAEINMRRLRTRMARYGTLVPPRSKVSWKQGWRELAGQRIYFRSRWEFNYAVYLEFRRAKGLIQKWEHEPETFWFDASKPLFKGIRRGAVSYLPDFRVTNLDGSVEYHEVKGWMDARSKIKLKRMKQYHATVKIRLIQESWFKQNGPKLSWLPGWEK